jgi:hypothetical protein
MFYLVPSIFDVISFRRRCSGFLPRILKEKSERLIVRLLADDISETRVK